MSRQLSAAEPWAGEPKSLNSLSFRLNLKAKWLPDWPDPSPYGALQELLTWIFLRSHSANTITSAITSVPVVIRGILVFLSTFFPVCWDCHDIILSISSYRFTVPQGDLQPYKPRVAGSLLSSLHWTRYLQMLILDFFP